MSSLYPWLAEPWQQWQKRLESGTFAHATLILSQQGMGAFQLAEQFARALMCTTYTSEPCGFCHGCGLMNSGSHPDYHVVRPEKEGKAITVDQIRQCNRWAQESSQLSGYRIIVIEPAEAMNESAANALLKTLEEPPEKCVFVLLTHQANHLLPTIVSRCQKLIIQTPAAQNVSDWVGTTLNQAIQPFAAHLHDNSPLLTKAFIEEGGIKQYNAVEQSFIRSLAGDMSAALECAKLIAQSPTRHLSWLWYLLSDAQKVQFAVSQPAQLPGAQAVSELLSYNVLYQQSHKLLEMMEQLRVFSGLNAELLITNWLFNINEETCL